MKRVFFCVSLMILMLGTGILTAVESEKPPVPRDDAYNQAREQLADLLASEDIEKIDISAATYDRAMNLIYMAVETYLDRSIPELGDARTALDLGKNVLKGLNEHKVHYKGDNGYDLVGDRNILIAQEDDARDLGELLARVAGMIHEAHGLPGLQAERAARRIFEGMLPVEGTGQSLVEQYLVSIRMLSKADRKMLLKYALE